MRGDEMPLILLTGSNSGIGNATARRLATRDVRLILHARNEQEARTTRDELARVVADGGGSGESSGGGQRSGGGPAASDRRIALAERLEIAVADLSSREAILAMAKEVRARHDHLDVLINNAGLAGGKEHTWTVNVLAPFLLAHELKPQLAASRFPGGARVLNVASVAQEPIDLDRLPRDPWARGPRSYGRSKMALVMLSFEMARRWRRDGIVVNALHPGTLLDTKMVRESFGAARGPADKGGEVLEYLALSHDLDGRTGKYFDQKRPARAAEQAYDEPARGRLWEITARAAGVAA